MVKYVFTEADVATAAFKIKSLVESKYSLTRAVGITDENVGYAEPADVTPETIEQILRETGNKKVR